MRKAPSSVLHVVVGAGVIPHFRNAIESIITHTNDRVFAVYNSISPADAARFSRYAENAGFGDRVVFRTLGNQGTSKTGSLYDAYNLAIDFAIEGHFDYLNLVQADCQLMWWSDALVTRLDEIFAAARVSDGPGVLCVGTIFPVFGKYVGSNIHNTIVFNSKLKTFVEMGAGMGDVGIFSISAIRASGFRFVDTETELQERYRRGGYVVPLLDAPCVAFIPWPATVRNGKVVGSVVEPLPAGTPMLQLVDGANPAATERSWGDSPFWMEDWVRPTGWNCLFPYWPTSIENPKWFRRRLRACQLLGVRPWATTRRIFEDSCGSAPGWSLVPSRRQIGIALASGYLGVFMNYQRRLLHSVAKRLMSVKR
jgi:hypothetical protein